MVRHVPIAMYVLQESALAPKSHAPPMTTNALVKCVTQIAVNANRIQAMMVPRVMMETFAPRMEAVQMANA